MCILFSLAKPSLLEQRTLICLFDFGSLFSWLCFWTHHVLKLCISIPSINWKELPLCFNLLWSQGPQFSHVLTCNLHNGPAHSNSTAESVQPQRVFNPRPHSREKRYWSTGVISRHMFPRVFGDLSFASCPRLNLDKPEEKAHPFQQQEAWVPIKVRISLLHSRADTLVVSYGI